MRRFVSIATVAALISSMLSPIMAAACTGTGKAASCHVTAAPHCDRPMHGHHHQTAATVSDFSLTAAESDAKCPMDCCTPGHPQSGAAIVATSILPPPAVSAPNPYFASVTFTSAGFSSHTDRGPPLA